MYTFIRSTKRLHTCFLQVLNKLALAPKSKILYRSWTQDNTANITFTWVHNNNAATKFWKLFLRYVFSVNFRWFELFDEIEFVTRNWSHRFLILLCTLSYFYALLHSALYFVIHLCTSSSMHFVIPLYILSFNHTLCYSAIIIYRPGARGIRWSITPNWCFVRYKDASCICLLWYFNNASYVARILFQLAR